MLNLEGQSLQIKDRLNVDWLGGGGGGGKLKTNH
jgi:hypothetical protein